MEIAGDVLIVFALIQGIDCSAIDLNRNGILYVLDIVQLVNIIFYGSLEL